MKSEKHLKSKNHMKTAQKPHAFHEKRVVFMRFSKDHLQGIVTLCLRMLLQVKNTIIILIQSTLSSDGLNTCLIKQSLRNRKVTENSSFHDIQQENSHYMSISWKLLISWYRKINYIGPQYNQISDFVCCRVSGDLKNKLQTNSERKEVETILIRLHTYAG